MASPGPYYLLPQPDGKAQDLTLENPIPKSGTSPRGVRLATAILASIFVLALAACGGQESAGDDSSQGSSKQQNAGTVARDEAKRTAEETTRAGGTDSARNGEAAELARAELGKKEITNMVPADGEKPDPGRQLPKDPL